MSFFTMLASSSRAALAALLLRMGLGIPFLIFGYGKIVDPITWLGFIPPWMSPLIPVSLERFLLIIGLVELVLGICLVLGVWTRIVACIAALHLISVLIAVGWNDIAVRDASMLLALLALACLASSDLPWSTDVWRHRSTMTKA